MKLDLDLESKIHAIDAAYLDMHGKDARRQFWSNQKGNASRARQILEYWGEASAQQCKARKMAKLGAIGRYFWPIELCLQALARDTLNATDLADTIMGVLAEDDGFKPGISDAKLKEFLLFLLRHQPRPLPPANLSPALVEALLKAAHQLNPSFQPWLIRDVLDGNDLQSPGAACKALAAALPEPEPAMELATLVHPSMRLGKGRSAPRHTQLCESIEWRLTSGDRNSQIQLLTGPSHEGKTTVLCELLLRGGINGSNSKANYNRSSCPTDLGLPAFVISCRDLTYAQLIEEVYVFLSRNPFEPRENPANLEILKSVPAQAMLRAIKDRARSPALYVFADLNVFEPGNIRRSLHGEGIGRLVTTLAEGSLSTRIIITSSHAPSESDHEVPKALIDATKHPMSSPQLVELLAFLPEHLKWEASRLVKATGREGGRVPGPVLQAAASTIAMLQRVDEDLVALLAEHAGWSQHSPPMLHSGSAQFFRRLWEALAEGLQPPTLRAFFLMAASDDGYTTESLKLALAEWPPADGPGAMGPDAVIEKLEELANLNNQRMLRRSNATRLLPYERSASERRHAVEGGALFNFQLDPPMQRGLCDALRDFRPEAFEIANTLTAKIARQRALNVKVGVARRYGQAQSDLRRDVQAYSCLLAGQTAAPDSTGPIAAAPSGALQNLDTGIFSLAARPGLRRVLRYAYNVIFRAEIDTDHRLSMVFDDDAIRLDLLFCLFEGVGKRFWGVEPGWMPAPEIPTHLLNSFSSEELCEMLVGIATTSHYCTRPDLTDWAIARFESLYNGLDTDVRLATQVRLGCVRADGILLRSPPQYLDRRRQLEELRMTLAGTLLVAANEIADEGRRLKTRVRVLHRLLRLDTLRLDFAQAQCTIRSIILAQEAYETANSDEADSLHGLAAISIMRTLFGDPVFDKPVWEHLGWSKDSTLAFFDNLIATAAGRLSRFGGAERHNVAMCRAYRETIAGNHDDAVVYCRQARDGIQIPTGSAEFRATTYWASAQIIFLAAEREGNKRRRHELWMEANADAYILYGQAQRWDFVAYMARASLLMSKIIWETAAAKMPLPPHSDIGKSIAHLEKVIKREGEIELEFASALAQDLLSKLIRVRAD